MDGRIRRMVTLAAASTLALGASIALAQNWFPSKYGASDEIGAANNLTPQKAQEAAKLVRSGKTYSLGMTVGKSTPAYPPREVGVTVVQPGQVAGITLGGTKTSYNDDIIHGWVGVGTQIDGLGHIGIDNVYYNGHKAADFAGITGLKKLGTEKIPPMATRGVLLDMTAVFGTDMLKEGTAFNRKEIDDAMRRQNVRIGRGDVVIFHTGWLALVGKDNKRYGDGEPGLGREGAQYLADLGVVAVGADTWGVEAVPFEQGAGVFEVHQILLARNGVYILENIVTAELVKDKAWEFMFVLGQPKYEGSVQAMINPVAIR